MHIAVKTAISEAFTNPLVIRLEVKLKAAPAAPKAVTGTPIASGEEKPNMGFRIKLIFSASIGRRRMPS